ncbi:MAG: signal recognition particle subunit SRP19/SEC65 family protein [Sulfolobales archaeon]
MSREIIIWLPYLDPTIPRRLGRRIPKNSLPRRPSIEELIEACKRLNIKCEIDRDKRYPRLWYQDTPRIRIYSDSKKSELIKALVRELKSVVR